MITHRAGKQLGKQLKYHEAVELQANAIILLQS